METRSIDSTTSRPEGQRDIDGLMLTMDLKRRISQVRSEPAWQANDRSSITIFKSEEMRMVLVGLKSGAELKTHTAKGRIVVQVIEGNMTFTANDEAVELTEGQIVTLQKETAHSVLATEETFFLLTMIMH